MKMKMKGELRGLGGESLVYVGVKQAWSAQKSCGGSWEVARRQEGPDVRRMIFVCLVDSLLQPCPGTPRYGTLTYLSFLMVASGTPCQWPAGICSDAREQMSGCILRRPPSGNFYGGERAQSAESIVDSTDVKLQDATPFFREKMLSFSASI